MSGVVRKALRELVRWGLLYGPGLVVLSWIGGCNAYKSYAEENIVRPHNEVVEARAHLVPVFQELAYIYYDPKKDRREHNVRLYRDEPQEALTRLINAKAVLDKHRESLEGTGYLERLPEYQLESAIGNVRNFSQEWPREAADWYAYLYGGDIQRPPSTYAKEIKNFFQAAEDARREVSVPKIDINKDGNIETVSFFAGLGASATTSSLLFLWYKLLMKGYSRVASKDDFRKRRRIISEYFGDPAAKS